MIVALIRKKATCLRHPTNAHFYTKTCFVSIFEDTFLRVRIKIPYFPDYSPKKPISAEKKKKKDFP